MIRVIWRYSSGLVGDVDERPPPPDEMVALAEARIRDFASAFDAEPVFSIPGSILRSEARALRQPDDLDSSQPDLASYSHAFFEDEEEAQAALARLRDDSEVEWAELQRPLSRPVWRPRSSSATPTVLGRLEVPMPAIHDFTAQQHYLDPSPRGVDARHAWTVPGGQGAGVSVFDLEVGWDLQHEDLRRNLTGLVHGSNLSEDHGTAVLGIIGADHNGFGVSGIAPRAHCAVAGVEFSTTDGKWNPEDSILHVLRSAPSGSVVLIELQGAWPGDSDFVPVELWQSTLDVISLATANGLVVVEAGGNGGNDLDRPPYETFFDRNAVDSGAILVGSGDPVDLSRLTHSNFGTRLDVHAWGTDVVSAGGKRQSGYDDLRTDTSTSRCYTKSFGGTSSASAIVAGCAACIQGALLGAGKSPLSSKELRELLVRTGAAQGVGLHNATENIGVRPDLRAALLELNL